MIRIILQVLVLTVCLSIPATLPGQLADSCRLRIGTNLAGPADWGSEWPFVNIMKYGRTWITHNAQWVDGGANDWDTGVLQHIPLDEYGYPLALPVENIPGTEAPQIVRSVWANTEALPAGTYVVLYDGTGTFGFWGDAEMTSSEPGRITVEVTPGVADIMAMELLTSEAGDPVRNIRFLLPGTEATHSGQPWSIEWLNKLEPFRALRFMDWGHTNSSTLQYWEDRPQTDDYTYTPNGIPYEWWVEICNLKQADAWVCIPHAADDHYIRQMARLFRDELDPNRTIYVEYSNEIWNWIFEQTHYCHDNGDQAVPWPERIVPFVQNAMDIWTEEFVGQEDRIVRVVGVQLAWQDVSNRIVNNMIPGSFDAFAPAAYFGFSEDGITALESLGANATADDVLFWAREGMLNEAVPWAKSQQGAIADALGIPMLYYEGGQHLTPQPFGSVQPYNPALVAAQSHPGMYDLYQEWFDSLRALSSGPDPTLLMNFSFIGPTSGQYGSWGALTSQFYQNPPYDDAPKYRALLDNTPGENGCGAPACLPDYAGINSLSGTVYSDITYESSGNIESDQIINTGINVAYNAGTSIVLKPGFEVQAGAAFSAYIAGCNPPPATMPGGTRAPFSRSAGPMAGSSVIKVYPNPVTAYATIAIDNDWRGKTRVYLVNMLGRTSTLRSFDKTEDFTTFEFDASPLPKGLYKIVASNGGHLATRSFVKM